MSRLVNFAGEGMPVYLWAQLAEAGQSVWDIGRERARRESGSFSYRNTVVREHDGEVRACLIGYPLPESPVPVDYDEIPAMFRPLQELEDLAPNTWYVNVLAAFPEHRGKGYGSDLLAMAGKLALATDRGGLSIIVSDANTGARRLYERSGYVETATRPMHKDDWENTGENWVLLIKRPI